MKYINKKTKAIIDSLSIISGGDWISYDQYLKERKYKSSNDKSIDQEELEKKEEVKKDNKGITKEEIMQELDSLGVEYDPKMKKDDLYKLMIEE